MTKSPEEREAEYATTVGYALHSWSLLEDALLRLFMALCEMPPPKARATFLAIISFETRLDVVHALIPWKEATANELPLWNKIYARLSKFHKKRHQLAHFAIVNTVRVKDGKRTEQTSLKPFWPANQDADGLSLAEIRERISKFDELARALDWFWVLADPRVVKPAGYPQPEPDLVLRLRSLTAQTHAAPPPPQKSSRRKSRKAHNWVG